jgi:hypothetical protein
VDLHELTGRSGGNRWIPLVAVVQDDFRQIIRHWAFLIWAGLALVLPILWLMNASSLAPGAIASLMRHVSGTHEVAKPMSNDETGRVGGSEPHLVAKQDGNFVPYEQDYAAQQRARQLAERQYDDDAQTYRPIRDAQAASSVPGTASQLGGKLLGMHLLVWIGLAMALGASAISSEFASIGESVMCWGVSRWQYFLGKIAARSTAAMTLVVLLTLPMLLVFNAKATGDLSFWPSIVTTLVCAAVVGCVVAAGVSVGTWFRSSMRAVAVAVVGMLVVGAGCAFLAPPAYSPTAFVASIPFGLRGVELAATSSLLSLTAWTAGGLAVVSLGKFVWADL